MYYPPFFPNSCNNCNLIVKNKSWSLANLLSSKEYCNIDFCICSVENTNKSIVVQGSFVVDDGTAKVCFIFAFIILEIEKNESLLPLLFFFIDLGTNIC